MSSAIRKSVFSFLVIALLLPGVYVAFQPREEARAFDVNQAVWNYVINPILTAVASAGYVYIKERLKFMSQNFVKEQFRNLVSGDKGKDPLLQEESLESFNRRVGQKASGAFMEGFAGAVENAVERDAKKARLAEKREKSQPIVEKSIADTDTILDKMDEKNCASTDALGNADRNTPPAGEGYSQECFTLFDELKGIQSDPAVVEAETSIANYDEDVQRTDQEFRASQANLIRQQPGSLGDYSKGLITAVCQPQVNIQAWLTLGVAEPDERDTICSWDQLTQNWTALTESIKNQVKPGEFNGWKAVRDMLNPNKTTLGYAFGYQTNLQRYIDDAASLAAGERQENFPIKNLKDWAGGIDTPGAIQKMGFESAIKMAQEEPGKLTGHFVADAVTTLLSSAIGQAVTIINSGILNADPIQVTYDGSGTFIDTSSSAVLYQPDFGDRTIQRRSEARLARFDALDLRPGGEINILAQLTNSNCPEQLTDPAKGGDESDPNACVLGRAFAQAVTERMTVQQAMDAYEKTGGSTGLNPNAIFGFRNTSGTGGVNPEKGSQPEWQNHLPYKSLVILRKYRVLPVSWEIAALYIQQNPNACGVGNCTLKTLVSLFDKETVKDASGNDIKNPFYRMIDPTWVLKLPAQQCALKGFGPIALEVKKEDLGQGATKGQIVRKEVCVDERTCLETDKNGKCVDGKFGYCLEEKRAWQFEGSTCKKEYAGCTQFTNQATKKSMYLIKDTIPDSACSEENAGCQWFSKNQNFAEATKDAKKWKGSNGATELNDRIYLNGRAQKLSCPPQAEGCRQVADNTFMRLPPQQLADGFCAVDAVDAADPSKTWYNRKECKPYAIQCKAEYNNCAVYTAEKQRNVQFAAGNQVNTCSDRSCAGLTEYIMQPSAFDPIARQKKIFTASAGRSCSSQHVGCTEFTNLDASDRRGEALDYFTKVIQCKPKVADQDTKLETVFYSTYGSEQGGYRVEKFYLEPDNPDDPKAPKCADGSQECGCDAEKARQQMSKPYDKECREFINAKTKAVSYRYKDNLVYFTDDCSSYRQTGTTGDPLSVSKSLSKSCPQQANKCREFHGPQSGNTAFMLFDPFTDAVEGWRAGASETIEASGEASTFRNKSMRVSHSTATQLTVTKDIPALENGTPYFVSFDVKTTVPTEVTVGLAIAANGKKVTLPGTGWQTVAVSFDETETTYEPSGARSVVLTLRSADGTSKVQAVFVDNVAVRENLDVVYKINDDSLRPPDQCHYDSATNTSNDVGCQLYKGPDNQSYAIRSVTNLCPVEMVGCKYFKAPDGTERYLIDDRAKHCTKEMNSCTAFGQPVLDAKGAVAVKKKSAEKSGDSGKCSNEEKKTCFKDSECGAGNACEIDVEQWKTVYYRVDPAKLDNDEDTRKQFSCKAEPTDADPNRKPDAFVGCQNFGNNVNMKDPGQNVYQYVDDPTASGAKAWMRKVCKLNNGQKSAIACSTNKDCITVKDSTGDCHFEAMDPGVANWPQSCPSSANTCREVTDPECVVKEWRMRLAERFDGPAPLWNSNPSGTATIVGGILRAEVSSSVSQLEIKREKTIFNDAKYRIEFDVRRSGDGQLPDPRVVSWDADVPAFADMDWFDRISRETRGAWTHFVYEGVVSLTNGKKERTLDIIFGNIQAPFVVELDNVVLNEASKGALRTNYGRMDGAPVLTCHDKYYVLADVAKNAGECNGQVNPDKGCLLFLDANERNEDGAVNKKYDSAAVYKEAWQNGSFKNTPVRAAANNDANVIYKVKQDRQCRVWLACTDWDARGTSTGDNKLVCRYRYPCEDGADGQECREEEKTGITGYMELDAQPKFKSALLIDPNDLLSFSGLARPDFSWEGREPQRTDGKVTRTIGGHNNTFQWFENLKDERTSEQIASGVGLEKSVWNLNVPTYGVEGTCRGSNPVKKCFSDGDCASGQKCDRDQDSKNFTPDPLIVKNIKADYPQIRHDPYYAEKAPRQCRLYPSRDMERCYVQEGTNITANKNVQNVINGYCLEPYPQYVGAFRDTGANRTMAKTYENHCLNWYPVDQITGQSPFVLKNDTNRYTAIATAKWEEKPDAYYCVARKSKDITLPRREVVKNTIDKKTISITFGKYSVDHFYERTGNQLSPSYGVKEACDWYKANGRPGPLDCISDGGAGYQPLSAGTACKEYARNRLSSAFVDGGVKMVGFQTCWVRYKETRYHRSAEAATQEIYDAITHGEKGSHSWMGGSASWGVMESKNLIAGTELSKPVTVDTLKKISYKITEIKEIPNNSYQEVTWFEGDVFRNGNITNSPYKDGMAVSHNSTTDENTFRNQPGEASALTGGWIVGRTGDNSNGVGITHSTAKTSWEADSNWLDGSEAGWTRVSDAARLGPEEKNGWPKRGNHAKENEAREFINGPNGANINIVDQYLRTNNPYPCVGYIKSNETNWGREVFYPKSFAAIKPKIRKNAKNEDEIYDFHIRFCNGVHWGEDATGRPDQSLKIEITMEYRGPQQCTPEGKGGVSEQSRSCEFGNREVYRETGDRITYHYCSDVIQVRSNKNVVTAGQIPQIPDKTKGGARLLDGVFEPNPTTNKLSSSYDLFNNNNQTPKGAYQPVEWCFTPDTGDSQCSMSRATEYLKDPAILSNNRTLTLGDIKDRLGEFIKIYGYWRFDINDKSASARTSTASGSLRLVNDDDIQWTNKDNPKVSGFENKLLHDPAAISVDHRPTIEGTRGNKPNIKSHPAPRSTRGGVTFVKGTVGLHRVNLDFRVRVRDEQLPLRTIKITAPGSTMDPGGNGVYRCGTEGADERPEGDGLNASGDGHRCEVSVSYLGNAGSWYGQEICIEAIDNWGGKTKECVTMPNTLE